jgi:putative ABC transport system permease protein
VIASVQRNPWHRVRRLLRLSIRLQLAHRRRTVLSVSALLLGVATVVVMSAVSAGAEARVVERIRAMGTDLLVIQAAPASVVAGRARQRSTVTTLRPSDAGLIANGSGLARVAAPAVLRSTVARWEGRNSPTTLLGTTSDGLRIQGIVAQVGRVFDELEERELRRVVVLGATVARNLFGSADPVGETVLAGRIPLEVIGVMRRRGTDVGGSDLDNTIAVPLSTAMRRVLNVPFIDALFVQARSPGDLDALEREARDLLAQRHRSRSGASTEFVVRNQAVLLRTERGATAALRGATLGTGALSLVVGAVGILAVMLLSVRERVGEIALRRAVGARLADIRIQFILESAILAGAGGAAGVLLGLVTAGLAALLGPWDLVLPWSAAIFGIGVSIAMGLLVGVIPAGRAARLDPAIGLRRA